MSEVFCPTCSKEICNCCSNALDAALERVKELEELYDNQSSRMCEMHSHSEMVELSEENEKLKAEIEHLKQNLSEACAARDQWRKTQLENERFKEALNRIVGMVEIWTDEHGQKKTEEIYASRIAREALKGCEK